MRRLFTTLAVCAGLMAPALLHAQAQRVGITADPLATFEDASMPAKEFRMLRTTYAPGGQNPKHYHTSHVVFYVLEGAGVWQEEGKEPVTLTPGDTLPCTCAPARSMPTAMRAPPSRWCFLSL
jgi:quercetin dioxygenase-like cupin family protein